MSGSVVAILLRTVLCAIIFDAIIPLSPFLVEDLRIHEDFFKSILALGMCLFAFFQLPSGVLISWLGVRLSLGLGSLFTGFACIALAFVQGAVSLAVALLLMFAFNAVASVAGRGLLRSLAGHTAYQKLSAYMFASISLIGILTPLVLVYLSHTYAWRWPLALLAVALSIVGVLLLFDQRLDGEKLSDGGKNGFAQGLALLSDSGVVFPILLGVATQGVYTSVSINKPFILLNGFGLSAPSLGIALALFAAFSVLGFFVAGKSVARLSDRQRALIGLSMQAAAVLLLALADIASSLACFALAVAACTLALAFLLPLSSAYALDVRPGDLAQASALYGFIQAGGAALVAYLATLNPLPALPGLTLLGAVCLMLSMFAVKRCRFKRAEVAG